ncbi:MAG TPA: hypothetical protein VF096_05315 [Azonexus sp.]
MNAQTTPATPAAPAVAFSPADLARRRRAARRLGWALGLTVLAIYLLGFLLPR